MSSQLVTNQWFGKALGFVCGWIFAPEAAEGTWLALCIIAGIGLGQAMDMWIAIQSGTAIPYRASSSSPLGSKRRTRSTARLSADHVEFLFVGMGQLAKLSGKVLRQHIDHAESVMRNLTIDGAIRDQCIAWFKRGQTGAYAFAQQAQKVLTAPHSGDAERKALLFYLAQHANLAIADRVVVKLKEFGQLLGFPASAVAQVLVDSRPNPDNSKQANNRQPSSGFAHTQPKLNPELASAYTALGIDSKATEAQVKTAYRRLVSSAHPDKLPPNATQAQHDAAQSRMVLLREALETILKAS